MTAELWPAEDGLAPGHSTAPGPPAARRTAEMPARPLDVPATDTTDSHRDDGGPMTYQPPRPAINGGRLELTGDLDLIYRGFGPRRGDAKQPHERLGPLPTAIQVRLDFALAHPHCAHRLPSGRRCGVYVFTIGQSCPQHRGRRSHTEAQRVHH